MAGRILKLEELSSAALADLDRENTVIFLPVSPIEGHGSHLPLGLDFLNARYFAEKAAAVTVENDKNVDAVICPGIPLAAQIYPQPGSLKTGNAVVYRVIRDMGASLARWGFRYIFIVSGHGSPRDIVALESAARRVSRKFGIQMHNLSGALAVRFLKGEFIDRISALLPEPLSDEERELLKHDIHGGWWETSMMLHLRPDLVDPAYVNLRNTRRSDNPRPPYFGSPSKATSEFAEASLKVMMEEAGETISLCLSGHDVTRRTSTPLYRILLLRPNFLRYLYLSTAGIAIAIVILLLSVRLIR